MNALEAELALLREPRRAAAAAGSARPLGRKFTAWDRGANFIMQCL